MSGVGTDRTDRHPYKGDVLSVRVSCPKTLAGQDWTCPALSGVCPGVRHDATTQTRSSHLPMQPFARSASAARMNAFCLALGLSLLEMAPW